MIVLVLVMERRLLTVLEIVMERQHMIAIIFVMGPQF